MPQNAIVSSVYRQKENKRLVVIDFMGGQSMQNKHVTFFQGRLKNMWRGEMGGFGEETGRNVGGGRDLKIVAKVFWRTWMNPFAPVGARGFLRVLSKFDRPSVDELSKTAPVGAVTNFHQF